MVCFSGALQMTALVPEGARGVFLKLELPHRYAYAEKTQVDAYCTVYVKSVFRFLNQAIPNLDGKEFVSSANAYNEVISERASGTFWGIESLVAWFH